MNTTERTLKKYAELLHYDRHTGTFLACRHRECVDALTALAPTGEVLSILRSEADMLGVASCTLQGFSENRIEGAPTVRTVVYRTEPDTSAQQQIRVCAWAESHQLFSTFVGPAPGVRMEKTDA